MPKQRRPSQGPAWSPQGRNNPPRRSTLPPRWSTIRRAVLDRDGHRCTWLDDGQRCNAPANQADHLDNPDDHSLANLTSLCAWHHARKSSRQGNDARRRPSERRPPERHPGLAD
jgi:5-methylcytosine-specific restriction protein A